MATRRDVALRAGVSQSTVSYVISGQRPISPQTRRRVEDAMRELNYTPNAFARGLAGARKGIVAVHYPYSADGLNSTEFEYVSAASERARRRGYQLLLWSNPIDDVEGLHGLVSQRLVDGVILMEALPVDPRIPVLKSAGLSFATIGRPDDTDGIAYVDDDFDSLARQAIDYVADVGHRLAVFVTQPEEVIGRGYGPLVRTSRAIVLPARRRGVRLVNVAVEKAVRGGHAAFEELMGLDPRPTAVISLNEMATCGLLHAAALAGVAIPDELSVVGLSISNAAAEMVTPPLTTVSPPSATIATTAMDALADAIEGKVSAIPQVLIPPVLTIRDSSAAPPT